MKFVRKLLLFSIILLLCIFSMAACSQDQDVTETADQTVEEAEDIQDAGSSGETGTDADEESITMR